MSPGLNALPRGHRFPAAFFDLSPAWVRQYAEATEDSATARAGEDLVPPMAVAALAVRAVLEQADLPPGAVHLGQELTFRRPLRAGESISTRARVASRGERRGWILMSIDIDVRDDRGQTVMTGRATVTMPSGDGDYR